MKRIMIFLLIVVNLMVFMGTSFAIDVSKVENTNDDDLAIANKNYYSDVPNDFWAIVPIARCSKFVSGFPDKTFKPNQNVSREQVATVLCKALNVNMAVDLTPKYEDVNPKSWSFPYIQAFSPFLESFSENGQSLFKPKAAVSRRELAVALVKVMNYGLSDLKNKNILSNYKDTGNILSKDRLYVALAIEKGFLRGFPDETFRGNSYVTRAQLVSIIDFIYNGRSQISTELNVVAPSKISKNSFSIYGTTDPDAIVTINGTNVSVNHINGSFTSTFTLTQEGSKEYVIVASLEGKSTQIKKIVTLEYPKPNIILNSLPSSSKVSSITVKGKVIANTAGAVKLTVNKQPITLSNDGNFSFAFPLTGGENQLTFLATNSLGKTVTVVKRVQFNTGGPVLIVGEAQRQTNLNEVRLFGSVHDKTDPSPKVFCNNDLVQLWEDGTFEIVRSLVAGENQLVIKAVNRDGKITTVYRDVTLKPDVPKLVVNQLPNIVSYDVLHIEGSAKDTIDESPILKINGEEVPIDDNGKFSYGIILKKGENTVNVVLTNSFGLKTEYTKVVTFATAPIITLNGFPSQVDTVTFSFSGHIQDEDLRNVSLRVNEWDVPVDTLNGYFFIRMRLKQGENIITVKVTNKHGLTTTMVKKISYIP